MSNLVKFDGVENKIIEIRNQKVILDSDIALLYGVTTKEINQAVKNNPDKFPEGYIFSLTKEEKTEVVRIFDHLAKLKFSPLHFNQETIISPSLCSAFQIVRSI